MINYLFFLAHTILSLQGKPRKHTFEYKSDAPVKIMLEAYRSFILYSSINVRLNILISTPIVLKESHESLNGVFESYHQLNIN